MGRGRGELDQGERDELNRMTPEVWLLSLFGGSKWDCAFFAPEACLGVCRGWGALVSINHTQKFAGGNSASATHLRFDVILRRCTAA